MTNYLLVTSNGTGMGHLTRQVAVAKAAPPGDSTLFSLSLGLPLATSLGVRGEYCPSYDMPWIASRQWHTYLQDRLLAIVEETNSDVVVFDGVAPYPGIGAAAAKLRQVAFVWLRRGMWQPSVGARQLQKSAYFDLIVEPGDLGSSADVGPTVGRGDSRTVGPISILECIDLLPRAAARKELGLPQEGPVALVTLGSGRLGDVAGPGLAAVETLIGRHPDWHLAVTRSPVALNEIPVESARRVTQLSGVYPLAPYLSAFDIAVSSAGYNAVHELAPAGVATLFVANTSTRTDDQSARARGIAIAGLGLACDDTELDNVPPLIDELVDETRRTALGNEAAKTLDLMTGARDTIDVVGEFSDSFVQRRRSPRVVMSAAWQKTKDTGKTVIGEDATTRLKTLLGRSPSPAHPRLAVTLRHTTDASSPTVPLLEIAEDLPSEQISPDAPLEHILPGSSERYHQARRDLIPIYYDVVP